MSNHVRLILYLVVAALIVAVFVASPAAWATPSRHALAQSIPTRTPTRGYNPTDIPTAPAGPGATDTPAPALPAGTALPVPISTVGPQGALTLALAPSRVAVWSGGIVAFTATVANTGQAALHQVTLEVVLPAGVELDEVLSGDLAPAGNGLELQAETLAPGARLTSAFRVRITAPATDVALVLRGVTSAAEGARATASAVLALPPLELPPTGSEARAAWIPQAGR